jgi:hypothetical protein
MLSLSGDELCVSGSFENKEFLLFPWTWPIFGGGKAKVAPDSQNDVTEQTTSTVAEDPSVSNVQSREEAVKVREEAVKAREAKVKEREKHVEIGTIVLNQEYEIQNNQRRQIEKENEELFRRQRDFASDSFSNLLMFSRFYKEILKKVLMDENRERCALAPDFTRWFVYNWEGCRSVYQSEYIRELKNILNIHGTGDRESDGLRIDVRDNTQRKVIFYTLSRLDKYMSEQKVTLENALNQLHKSMDYDDNHENAPEDNDIAEVGEKDVDLKGVRGGGL